MTVHWHDDECTWCPCDEPPATEHRSRPAWGMEGEVCAACHDWWPCADAPVSVSP